MTDKNDSQIESMIDQKINGIRTELKQELEHPLRTVTRWMLSLAIVGGIVTFIGSKWLEDPRFPEIVHSEVLMTPDALMLNLKNEWQNEEEKWGDLPTLLNKRMNISAQNAQVMVFSGSQVFRLKERSAPIICELLGNFDLKSQSKESQIKIESACNNGSSSAEFTYEPLYIPFVAGHCNDVTLDVGITGEAIPRLDGEPKISVEEYSSNPNSASGNELRSKRDNVALITLEDPFKPEAYVHKSPFKLVGWTHSEVEGQATPVVLNKLNLNGRQPLKFAPIGEPKMNWVTFIPSEQGIEFLNKDDPGKRSIHVLVAVHVSNNSICQTE